MVEAPKVPLPGYLANALANVKPSPRAVQFAPLHGAYVTKHDNGKPVRIVRGSFTRECVWFLLFKTTLNTDFDGAPDSFAPPVGINQPSGPNNNPGLNGLRPRDWIFNATNKKFPPEHFHADGMNHFEWTGVKSAAAGANIDNRLFLRDFQADTGLRRFPIIQRNGPFAGFYEPQTAMEMIDGGVRRAVDPLVVPYAVLSNELKTHGRVSLGDVGLAVRVKTGHATPIIYADAGGKRSNSVGEYSATTVSNLGNPNEGEEIFIMSFAQSNISDVVDPARIEPTLRRCVASLNEFSNPRDIVANWLPYHPSPFLGAALPALKNAFDYAHDLAFAQLLGALTRFGLAA
jgi:hypothetical protein